METKRKESLVVADDDNASLITENLIAYHKKYYSVGGIIQGIGDILLVVLLLLLNLIYIKNC